jgi:hypothetical protein
VNGVLTLVVCLLAPLAAAPLLVMLSRHLFSTFVREAAELFLGMQMHREQRMALGTDLAVINAIIFSIAWMTAVALHACHLSSFIVVAPFLLAMLAALYFTSSMVRGRMKLPSRDAYLVGLLSFAGGNLPLIVIIPLLLITIMNQEPMLQLAAAE